jgi:tRNA U34 5-methylaminomethyl-2-thiouridine-forming methyltransferase MnmC
MLQNTLSLHTNQGQLKKLIITSDGSHTIYVPELNEHYHSVHGAVQESNFIFINTGFESCKSNPVNIFEVGFGTGLNALLTAMKNSSGIKEVNYTAIEKYPVDESTVSLLNYNLFTGEKGREIFDMIHSAPWDKWVKIYKNFNLLKINGDIVDYPIPGKYNLIYFDAFGPDKQPEIWMPEVFETIAAATENNGIFVTYSAKGEVKRNLKACGFEVTLLPGPPGKRQIIRAVKI